MRSLPNVVVPVMLILLPVSQIIPPLYTEPEPSLFNCIFPELRFIDPCVIYSPEDPNVTPAYFKFIPLLTSNLKYVSAFLYISIPLLSMYTPTVLLLYPVLPSDRSYPPSFIVKYLENSVSESIWNAFIELANILPPSIIVLSFGWPINFNRLYVELLLPNPFASIIYGSIPSGIKPFS